MAASGSSPGGGWTSYSVTLAPLGTGTGCADGTEGVSVQTRTVRSPRDGRLEVRMRDLPGDFDVLLLDVAGHQVGSGGQGDQSLGPSRTEQATVRVRRGTVLRIRACNYSSPVPRATVEYRFVPAQADAPVARGFAALRPGGLPRLHERVPVNVVLVGFPDVSATALRGRLPKVSRPHERIPSFYGYEKPLGITYTYAYRFSRPSAAWQDALFRQLRRLGRPHARTAQQVAYDDEPARRTTVRDVLAIDAGATEKWLADHPPAGVDTRQDTVFLLDWWGRRDFRFHYYRHANEPVSGTHWEAGAQDVRALQAWGGSTKDDPESGLGSTRRVWFDDLSAGPDYWTGSFTLAADVDGDGLPDRHVVPSWEYGHAVPRSRLTEDLAGVLRYVAVDTLFTASPLYGLRSQGDVLAGSVDIDMNVADLDPQDHRVSYLPGTVARADNGLSPLVRASSDLQVVTAGEQPEAAACLGHYLAISQAPVYAPQPSCEPQYAYSGYNDLWLYGASHLGTYLDDARRVDREVPVFSYQVADQGASCFALADDDHATGTASLVYGTLPTTCRSYVGNTDIFTHESGHELGMSHPHDGYDYEQDRDFGAYGDTYLAAVGDESSTVMSYLDVDNEYSQFDADNYARWTTAAHLAAVDDIAAQVLGRPAAQAALHDADELAVRAARLFTGHDYQGAAAAAREAWKAAVRGALRAGVVIRPSRRATTPVSTVDDVPTGALGVPKGRGYARSHVLDPSTGLPVRCAACRPATPPLLLDRPGLRPAAR